MESNELLTRRVAKILPSSLELSTLMSRRKIRLYQGFDPTGGHLHLGHTIGLRKLMEFARAGHEVIFLFGTGTVLVGDPSERDTGRKLITQEEIEANISDWKRQVSPIVDFDLVTIRQNGDWLTKMKLKDIIEVASKISSVQLFKRASFTRRINKGETVWYHETMYPLLQGYDSVVMDVDLEIGGTDQEFNMLVGRELQRKMNNREKYVLTTPMIMGTDGKTMSKTSGNCIFLDESPLDMYGKLMAVRDELIPTYFELLTDMGMSEIASLDPREPLANKKALALRITSELHGQTKALEAQKAFSLTVQGGQAPEDAPSVKLASGKQTVRHILKSASLGVSNAQLKRTVEDGGVEIGGVKILEIDKEIEVKPGSILKFGKRNFRKLEID